uniref:transposase n=1 Tax=Streptomyces johnsoniae TaxID=3075532 RepID=UPI00374E1F0B
MEQRLIDQLVDRAHVEGLKLPGEGGLLQQLNKQPLEPVFEGEMTDHVGDDKHDAAGRNSGNSRDGTRSKTVLTDVGGDNGAARPGRFLRAGDRQEAAEAPDRGGPRRTHGRSGQGPSLRSSARR